MNQFKVHTLDGAPTDACMYDERPSLERPPCQHPHPTLPPCHPATVPPYHPATLPPCHPAPLSASATPSPPPPPGTTTSALPAGALPARKARGGAPPRARSHDARGHASDGRQLGSLRITAADAREHAGSGRGYYYAQSRLTSTQGPSPHLHDRQLQGRATATRAASRAARRGASTITLSTQDRLCRAHPAASDQDEPPKSKISTHRLRLRVDENGAFYPPSL